MDLDFDGIKKRIETEKKKCKGSWASFVGVSPNIVSNIHGKMAQKPSLNYIANVSRATGKSVDYFLWGDLDNKNFNNIFSFVDCSRAERILANLAAIEQTDLQAFERCETYIQATADGVLSTKKAG